MIRYMITYHISFFALISIHNNKYNIYYAIETVW